MASLTQAEFKVLWQFKAHEDGDQTVPHLSTEQVKNAWKREDRAIANRALLSLMVKGLLTVDRPGSVCLTTEGEVLVAALQD